MKRPYALLLAALLLSSACDKTGGNGASFSLSDLSSTEFTAEGGTFTATAHWEYCKYKVSTDGAFVSLPDFVYIGDVNGTGSRDLSFTVAPNTSPEARTAHLSFQLTDGESSPDAQPVTVTLTQAGKPREAVTVTVQAGNKYQTWDGFGAMNLGGNWSRPVDWSEGEVDSFMRTLGLNIMRIRIPYNESDWKAVRDGCRYAYEKYGAAILASPWTMPASMKNPEQLEAKKNDVTSSLKPSAYEDYAKYLEKFAAYMKDGGVPLEAISIQNEPDWPATYEGCVWSAEEHLSFVRDYGHLIQSARLVTGESMQSTHSFYDPVLKDAAACANIDIVGGHLYGVKPQTYNLAAEKNKRLWMTEHLYDESWSKGTDHWAETMDMLAEIHGCLVNGWNAYIWWYGIRYYSFLGDGDEGTTRGRILLRGHAFSQYAKYIRPGDVRLGTTAAGTGAETLLATAFQGTDHLTVTLLNTSSSQKEVTVDLGTAATGTTATCTSSNASGTDVTLTVQGTRVELSLPPSSITTLRR